MFTQKRLITVVVLVVGTIMIVIAVAIVAGIFFLRGSSDTVAMAAATAVGVPNGPATTKSLGPAGGSIASSDGRITVTVPPNAVPGPLDFSIQPITNLAQGGMGSAYRLQPDGLKFATPIKVSFKYDTPDFKAYRPETLAVAYQDPTGIWQAFKTANIDTASKTLTISTTHFTDESVFTDQLSPEKATLRVGETQEVELKCTQPVLSWVTRLKIRLGIGHQFGSRCWTIDDTSWSVNAGTLIRTGPLSAVYQAPATRPSPNVATIRFVYHYKGTSPNMEDVRECEITIIDRGYRASGKIFDTVLSGDICDLEKRFTIKTNSKFNTDFECVPSSPTAGTCAVSETEWGGGGGGPYTITGTDILKTGIELTFSGKSYIGGMTGKGGGPIHIDLVPLDEKCKP